MDTDSYNLQARKVGQGKSRVDRDQAHAGWGEQSPEFHRHVMPLGDNLPSNDFLPPKRGRNVSTGLLWEKE